MKLIRNFIFILFILITLTISGLILFDKPNNKVIGENLSTIKQIEYTKDSAYTFNDEQIEKFKSLEFTLAENFYPGETPDFQYLIKTESSDYTLIYNINDDKVFFMFGDEFNYNFFSNPNGGWNKPLYYLNKTEDFSKIFPTIIK